MTHSRLTDKIRLSKKWSGRRSAKVDTFLVHHTASVSGRGDGVVNMMVNPLRRQVSSNYVLGSDGYLWMVVDEDLRAWTSGSKRDGGKGAAWDRRSITIEICNSSGAPNWGISNASIDKAARLLIDLRRRYGISRVIGHRDLWTRWRASYATYCPGPDTVARILRREKEILGGQVSQLAGSATKTYLSAPTPEEVDMYLLRTTDGTIGLVTSQGYAPLTDGSHLVLFQRLFAAHPGWDTFNRVERDIIVGYIRQAAGGQTSPGLVTAASVADAVKAALTGATIPATVDVAAIVEAVEASLADDFAAIPAATRAAIVK